MKISGTMPVRADNINIAVKRPTVNLKESENLGEEAAAAAARFKAAAPSPTDPNSPFGASKEQKPTFAKHGTLYSKKHPLEEAWER